MSAGWPWVKFHVARQASETQLLSLVARGLDAALTLDAIAAPDGVCGVELSRIEAHCDREGLDHSALGRTLVKSGRWRWDGEQKLLVCTWLLELRAGYDARIAKLSKAGTISGQKRAAKKEQAAERRARKAAKVAPGQVLNICAPGENPTDPASPFPLAETGGNPLTGADLHTGSTSVEQIREEPITPLTSLDGVIGSSTAVAVAATAPVAGRAGGAPSAAAGTEAPAPRVQMGHLLRLQAAQVLEAVPAPPSVFRFAALGFVERLEAAAPEVDVERPLFRACAAWQAGGDLEAHGPLLDEIAALMIGRDGRAGLLEVAQAPRAVALALHGALIMPAKLQPRVLRALAAQIARDMAPDETDPLRVACFIAGEFARGKRSALGYMLASDPMPERALPLAGVA